MTDHRPFGDDDFSATTLDARWSWVNPDPARWSLTARPGFLRILTTPGNVGSENLALQNAPSGGYLVQTRLLFTPTGNYQMAGIVLYKDSANYLMLGRAYCDTPAPTCVGNGISFDYLEEGEMVGSNYPTEVASTNEAWLRLERVGDVLTGSYNEGWVRLGNSVPPLMMRAIAATIRDEILDKV